MPAKCVPIGGSTPPSAAAREALNAAHKNTSSDVARSNRPTVEDADPTTFRRTADRKAKHPSIGQRDDQYAQTH